MRFGTALALAAGVHGLALLLLWRTWPPPAPLGEVVPLELRAAEPPPPPPPGDDPPPAPLSPHVVAPVAAPAAGGGKGAKRAPKMVVTMQPEPAGDVPAAPAPVEAGPTTGGGATTGSGGATTGSGGGNSGSGGPGTASSGPPAAAAGVDRGPLRAQALERIRQQRRYPELARRRRIEGTVIVAFRITTDGGVSGLRIKQGVDELLDQAALEAVRAATPLPGALAADGELEMPFRFYLPR